MAGIYHSVGGRWTVRARDDEEIVHILFSPLLTWYNQFADRSLCLKAQANHEGTARCPQVGDVVADFCPQTE